MPIRPPVHRPPHWREPERVEAERHKHYDRFRGTSEDRGYSHTWRKFRKAWITAHPLCSKCEAEGRITIATEVHHLVPVAIDKTRICDPTNVVSRCHPCHMSDEADIRRKAKR